MHCKNGQFFMQFFLPSLSKNIPISLRIKKSYQHESKILTDSPAIQPWIYSRCFGLPIQNQGGTSIQLTVVHCAICSTRAADSWRHQGTKTTFPITGHQSVALLLASWSSRSPREWMKLKLLLYYMYNTGDLQSYIVSFYIKMATVVQNPLKS